MALQPFLCNYPKLDKCTKFGLVHTAPLLADFEPKITKNYPSNFKELTHSSIGTKSRAVVDKEFCI